MLLDDPQYIHSQSLKDAYAYFDALSDTAAETESNVHFNGANNIGMVDLVCLTNEAANLTSGDDTKLTAVMESLSNILVAAVMKKSGNDPKNLTDPALWEKGYNALVSLFCSGYSRNTVSYNDKVIGPATVKEVIKIAFDVNGDLTLR